MRRTGWRWACWVLLGACATGAWAQAPERPYYFRVDTGYSWAQGAGFHDRQFTPGPLSYLVCGNAACTAPAAIDHLGASGIYGAGAGWRFNPQLRADLTLGWRKFTLDGIDQFPENVHADVKSQVTMLTGYWDIPVDYKVKPFVGLGIGVSRNKMGITTDTFILPPGTIEASTGVKNSTAFSFSAGAGYKVCDGVVVEVGYRYLDLGRIQTGNTVTFTGGFSIPFQGAEGKLRSNEITLGLRF